MFHIKDDKSLIIYQIGFDMFELIVVLNPAKLEKQEFNNY